MNRMLNQAPGWLAGFVMMVTGALGPWPPAQAQPTEPTPAPALDEGAEAWRVDFYTWLWTFGISGDIGVGPVTIENIDAHFLDVVDASDSIIAFSGRLEVGYDRFTGFVDGTYANVGADDQTGPLGLASVDVTTEIGTVDFGLMYRVTEWNNDAGAPDGYLDVYAGGRYIAIDVELDPAAAPTREGDRDWVDPIVGVKVSQPLTKRLHVDAWGDIGGFGVESDLTWSATAVLGLDFELFNKPATVYGGYRAISWDYSDGSGANRFEWDVILHGPTLGLRVRF